MINCSELCKIPAKIYNTLVGGRHIVASYYCSTNPLSDTIPEIFKTIFDTVESFYKVFFIQAVRNSGKCKIFSDWTMLNKIHVRKTSILTFNCSTSYTTILHKLLLKVLSEVINFVFKSKKSVNDWLLQTYIYWTSKWAWRELEEDTSLNKPMSINKCFFTLLVASFLNKILVYQWELTQHHFGPTSFFNSLNLII